MEAADAGTHRHANPLVVFRGYFKAGIGQCIAAGSDTVVHELIDLACIARLQVFLYIEVFYFTGNSGGELARVERGNRRYAGAPFTHVLPRRFQLVAHRRDDAHAGYNDASFAQVAIPGTYK